MQEIWATGEYSPQRLSGMELPRPRQANGTRIPSSVRILTMIEERGGYFFFFFLVTFLAFFFFVTFLLTVAFLEVFFFFEVFAVLFFEVLFLEALFFFPLAAFFFVDFFFAPLAAFLGRFLPKAASHPSEYFCVVPERRIVIDYCPLIIFFERRSLLNAVYEPLIVNRGGLIGQ